MGRGMHIEHAIYYRFVGSVVVVRSFRSRATFPLGKLNLNLLLAGVDDSGFVSAAHRWRRRWHWLHLYYYLYVCCAVSWCAAIIFPFIFTYFLCSFDLFRSSLILFLYFALAETRVRVHFRHVCQENHNHMNENKQNAHESTERAKWIMPTQKKIEASCDTKHIFQTQHSVFSFSCWCRAHFWYSWWPRNAFPIHTMKSWRLAVILAYSFSASDLASAKNTRKKRYAIDFHFSFQTLPISDNANGMFDECFWRASHILDPRNGWKRVHDGCEHISSRTDASESLSRRRPKRKCRTTIGIRSVQYVKCNQLCMPNRGTLDPYFILHIHLDMFFRRIQRVLSPKIKQFRARFARMKHK